MSATRYPVVDPVDPHVVERLHIVDPGGDELVVRRLRDADDGFVVMLDTGTAPVALDVDDTLALLSFLADAAGVERYVPQVELRDVAVVAQPLHPSWTVERVDPAGCAWCGEPAAAHPVRTGTSTTCTEYVDASTAGGDQS